MPFDIGSMGMQAAGQAIGTIMAPAVSGMNRLFGIDSYNDKRQLKQQQALTDMQVIAQKDLADYSYGLQSQMFNKTASYNSPINQMNRLKEAGLNPALMYGIGGGGSGITGSASAGQASGGQAANAAQTQANSIAQAQLGVMQSQANLNNAQAENIRGVGTEKTLAEIGNLKAATDKIIAETTNEAIKGALMKSQTTSMDIANEIAAATKDTAIATATAGLNKLNAEVGKLISETNYQNLKSDEQRTVNAYLTRTIESNLALAAAQTYAAAASGRLSEEQTRLAGEQVAIGWMQANAAVGHVANQSEANRIAQENMHHTWEAKAIELGISKDKAHADFVKSPIGAAWTLINNLDHAIGGDWQFGSRQMNNPIIQR